MAMKGQKPVTLAVVGLGRAGIRHARAAASLADAHVAVCCDTDPGRAALCPVGSRFTTDLRDALSEPRLEAVIVATPEVSHREATVAALDRGLAVLCEKPMAHTLEDADTMIRAAEEYGAPLVVGHILRFHPYYTALKRAQDSDRLGAPVHLVARLNCCAQEGRAYAERTTLALAEGTHELDILRWFAGDVRRVYAEGVSGLSVASDGLDCIVATLRFASGAVGILELSWGLPDSTGLFWGDRYFSYIGTDAVATLSLMDQGLRIFGTGNLDTGAVGPSQGVIELLDTSFAPEIHGMPSGPFVAQLAHFLTVVRMGVSPVVTAVEARAAVEAALAIEESARTGRVVELQ